MPIFFLKKYASHRDVNALARYHSVNLYNKSNISGIESSPANKYQKNLPQKINSKRNI